MVSFHQTVYCKLLFDLTKTLPVWSFQLFKIISLGRDGSLIVDNLNPNSVSSNIYRQQKGEWKNK
jgi:hypothetical protein